MGIASSDHQGQETGGRLKGKLVPLLILLLATGITLGLFFLVPQEEVKRLGNYGYIGVFIVSVISNATVILPVPGIFVVFPLVSALSPVWLGLVGGAGGTIGEITGYMVGYSGRAVLQRGRRYERFESWVTRWGVGKTVFVFAVAPFLLVDIAGAVAGALRYPLWKFLVIVWVGKSIKYVAMMLALSWGWQWLVPPIQ